MEYQLKEWVLRGKQGDGHAQEVILDKLEPLMKSVIARYGRGEWEDLMQEARETVLKCICEFDEDRGAPFLMYAKGALLFRIRNLARAEKICDSLDSPMPDGETAPLELLESPDLSPAEHFETHEMGEMVRQAIQKLSPEQREVLLLHFYSGISLKDIALGRGVHYQTVKGLKKRALTQMKKIMSDYILS